MPCLAHLLPTKSANAVISKAFLGDLVDQAGPGYDHAVAIAPGGPCRRERPGRRRSDGTSMSIALMQGRLVGRVALVIGREAQPRDLARVAEAAVGHHAPTRASSAAFTRWRRPRPRRRVLAAVHDSTGRRQSSIALRCGWPRSREHFQPFSPACRHVAQREGRSDQHRLEPATADARFWIAGAKPRSNKAVATVGRADGASLSRVGA